MVVATVKWFHQVMEHPGEKRLWETLSQRYYHPRLCYHIEKLKFKDCQKHKLEGRGYGLLPKQEVRIAPWEEVAINLIGPWKVKVNGWQVEFIAFTCIDTVSNLVKLICIYNKTANTYVTRSHKVGFVDILILYDVFMSWEVNSLDRIFNGYWKSLASRMYAQPAKIHNLMLCERMHQTATNVLRKLVHTNPPWNITQAIRDIIDDALATARHAMQTAVATTLGSMPGALAFARDMFLNMPLIADWQGIAGTCEHHVNENLWHANRKRRQYDYASGQQVLKKVHNPTKLGVRTKGP
jgi:hypothetical protein